MKLSFLNTVLALIRRPTKGKPAKPRRKSARLNVELLEDRLVPAVGVAHNLPMPLPPVHQDYFVSRNVPASVTQGQVNTAEGLAALDMFGESTKAGVPGIATPISIARVLNESLPGHDTFLVALIGVDPSAPASQVNSVGTIHNAVLDLPDPYRTAALQAIKKLVPAGSTLILTGHSLGGIEAQNLVPDVLALGYHVSAVITFGSPETTLPVPGVRYVRFMAEGDLITSISPLGFALGLIGHPEQIQFQATGVNYAGPQPTLPTSWPAVLANLDQLFTEALAVHLSYRTDLALTGYDALGYPAPDNAVLRLGPIVRV
jgi:Lipase (class 3)